MIKRMMIAVALTASMPFSGAYAEMQKLGENTYHFFDGGYGSLVVVGSNGALVVDPANPERAKKLKAEVAQITDKPVTHVVLSHEHYDHVGGTEVFNNAEIVCQEGCQAIFDLDVMGLVPEKVTMSFAEKLSIDLGEVTTELHFFGAGDGVATSVAYVPQDGVAATTDLYDPYSLTNGRWIDDSNFLGKRKILNEMARWNLKYSISGHSPDTTVKALDASRNYMNDLYTAVKEELDPVIAKGGLWPAYQLLSGDLPSNLKLPAYKEWDGYNEHLSRHIWRMGMSIAHGG